MKTNRFNAESVNFATIKNDAKVEIKKATNSIFFWRKQLVAMSQKNEFCEGMKVSTIEKAVRNYTKGGQKWDVSIFPKDYLGRFCTTAKYTENVYTVNDLISGDIITDSKGREMLLSGDSQTLLVLQPVTMSLVGVFNAFCKVATKEIRDIEKAQKDLICEEERAQKRHEKEIKKAQKIKVRKLNELAKKLEKGEISAYEYNKKVSELNAA